MASVSPRGRTLSAEQLGMYPSSSVWVRVSSSRLLWRIGNCLPALLLAGVALQTILCFDDIAYYEENAISELAQNWFLFLGGILFLSAAIRAAERIARLSLLLLSVFCLTILAREIEVNGTVLEPYLASVIQYDLHYASVGLAALSIFLLSLRHVRTSVGGMLRWMTTTHAGRWLLLGAFLYLLGDGAEKGLFSADAEISQMLEETLEQIGTMFFFISACATLRNRKSAAAFSSPQRL